MGQTSYILSEKVEYSYKIHETLIKCFQDEDFVKYFHEYKGSHFHYNEKWN